MDILSPLICFIVFLFVASMLWSFSRQTVLISLVPLLLLTLFFDYWVIYSQVRVRYLLVGNPEYPFRLLDHVIIGSSIYDVITLFLVNILFVWNLSLLYRLVSKNRQSQMS